MLLLYQEIAMSHENSDGRVHNRVGMTVSVEKNDVY